MTKYRLQSIVLVLVAFMLGCNEFMVVGILSDLSNTFSVSISTVGFLVTAFATVYAISTPFVTISFSKYNRFTIMMILMVIFLIGNTMTALAPNYTFLVIARVLTAMTAGSIISFAMTFASIIAPANKRASLVSWIFAGFSIASVFGVPIGTAVSTSFGWRWAFIAISFISVITIVALFFTLPRHVEQVSSSIIGQLSLLKDPRIYLGIVLVLFTAATMYAYYTYIRPLLTTALGFSNSWLNWLLFAIGIMSIISNRWSGTIAEGAGLKVMPKFYVFDIFILITLSLSLTTKITGLASLFLLTLVVTLLNSPIQIHFLNIAEKEYPQSLLLASSLNSIFFNFGISLGSATSSILVGVIHLNNLGFGAAVFAILSLIFSVLLNNSINKVTKQKQG